MGSGTGGLSRAPRGVAHGGQGCEVHGDVEGGDEKYRQQDGAWNRLLWLPNLAAQKADVVVAPVVVGGDERSLRKAAQGNADRLLWRGRHVPAAAGRRTSEPRNDDARDGCEHTGEEHPGATGHGAEIAIEQGC